MAMSSELLSRPSRTQELDCCLSGDTWDIGFRVWDYRVIGSRV